MASLKQDFLRQIEDFLVAARMTPTKFGVQAARDPRFVFDLREGRSCGADVIDKVRSWMKGRAV